MGATGVVGRVTVASKKTMIRTTILLVFSVFLSAACSGGSGDGVRDGAVVVDDADINAPDANPNGGDAGAAPDASVSAADAGATAGIECGMETCNVSTQECCITGGPGGGGSTACVAEGTCEGTPAACDGPEDCGGDICCGTFGGTTCETTCEGQGSAELCHSASDCSASGDMCCDFGPLSLCAASCGGGGGF